MSLLGWLFRSADIEHYKRGIAHFNAGEYEQAIAAFEAAPDESDGERGAFRRLGCFYAAEAHARIGEALVEEGELERAGQELARAIEMGQDFPDRLALLARVRHIQGQTQAAIDLLARALVLNPSYRAARAELALCLDEAGNRAEAWEAARNADALGLPAADPAESAAVRSDEALTDAVRARLLAIVAEHGEPRRRMRHAEERAARGHDGDALAEFETLVRDFPDYPDIRLRFAVILQRSGQHGEAKSHLRRALELNPRYSEALIQMGVVCLREGDPRDSLRWFERAAQARSGHADTLLLQALACVRLGEWTPAAQRLEQTAATHAGRRAALLGMMRWAQGEESEARELLAGAVAANPGLAWAAEACAYLQTAAGAHVEARRVLDAALHLQPENVHLRLARARVLRDCGELPAALEVLEQILAQSPRHSGALAWKGRLLMERGEFAAAEIPLQAAVGVDGGSGRHWRMLGRTLLRQGKNQEAARALATAVEKGADSGEASLELALCYYRQSRAAEGAEALRRVDPADAEHPLVRLLAASDFVDEL